MNTENKPQTALDRAEEVVRMNGILMAGMLKIQALLGSNPVRHDVSKADVSDIIADTMQKITS